MTVLPSLRSMTTDSEAPVVFAESRFVHHASLSNSSDLRSLMDPMQLFRTLSFVWTPQFDLVLLEVPESDVPHLERRVIADEPYERVATMSTHIHIVKPCQILVSSLLHCAPRKPSISDLAASVLSGFLLQQKDLSEANRFSQSSFVPFSRIFHYQREDHCHRRGPPS